MPSSVRSSGCSTRPSPAPWTIKDGFRVLDLAQLDFEVLFEAEWLGLRRAACHCPRLPPGTSRGHPSPTMRAWRAGRRPGAAATRTPMPPACRASSARPCSPIPDIRFLAGRAGESIVAVAIANRSDDGSGPVVGISNIVLPRRGSRSSTARELWPRSARRSRACRWSATSGQTTSSRCSAWASGRSVRLRVWISAA